MANILPSSEASAAEAAWPTEFRLTFKQGAADAGVLAWETDAAFRQVGQRVAAAHLFNRYRAEGLTVKEADERINAEICVARGTLADWRAKAKKARREPEPEPELLVVKKPKPRPPKQQPYRVPGHGRSYKSAAPGWKGSVTPLNPSSTAA